MIEENMADDRPIVCTLTPGELAGRRGALLPGLAARAQRVARAEHGYRLVFAPAPELLRAIADVVEAERHCCQFLRFELTVEAGLGAVSLTVTGLQARRRCWQGC